MPCYVVAGHLPGRQYFCAVLCVFMLRIGVGEAGGWLGCNIVCPFHVGKQGC